MGGLEILLDIFLAPAKIGIFVPPSFLCAVEGPKGHNYSPVFVNATNTIFHLSCTDAAAASLLPLQAKLPGYTWVKSCLNLARMDSVSGCSRQKVKFPKHFRSSCNVFDSYLGT